MAIRDGKRRAGAERASAEVELPMFAGLESSACQADEGEQPC